jgi:tetratricopeptide (TPR) repeat protein
MRFKDARLIFLIFCLLVGGCHRTRPPVTAPPPILPPPTTPTSFSLAEASYNSGRYSDAAQAYERYLFENPVGPNRDKALFRVGMCLAFDGASPQNQEEAQSRFRYLVEQYPKSPYRREAEFILGLQASIVKLRIDLVEKDSSLKEMEASLETRDVTIKGKEKALLAREAALKEKDATLKEKDATIERLTRELERMKKIDLERRPSRPPD